MTGQQTQQQVQVEEGERRTWARESKTRREPSSFFSTNKTIVSKLC
jgi:hypothetical protein